MVKQSIRWCVAAMMLIGAAGGLTDRAQASPLIVADVGGTASMPIQGPYTGLTPMKIIDGLPMGTVVNIAATLNAPVVSAEQPGGTLGGTRAAGGGGLFTWSMQGTGLLSGYSRNLTFPALPPPGVATFADPAFNVIGSDYEVHSATRTPFAPVQSYSTDMFRMFSQIAGGGDPDFDLLRVVAGSDFGLPSPGHTTLTNVGGGWNVDSFFDITYRIDFVGRPGGNFAGMSGSTTGTIRMVAGMPIPEPSSAALAGLALLAAVPLRRR